MQTNGIGNGYHVSDRGDEGTEPFQHQQGMYNGYGAASANEQPVQQQIPIKNELTEPVEPKMEEDRLDPDIPPPAPLPADVPMDDMPDSR